MGTNLARLKSGKGAPPSPEATADVTKGDLRADAATMRPLQVRIPESVFLEFSEQAGREFGFTHGSKKQLFLKIWAAYKAQNM